MKDVNIKDINKEAQKQFKKCQKACKEHETAVYITVATLAVVGLTWALRCAAKKAKEQDNDVHP